MLPLNLLHLLLLVKCADAQPPYGKVGGAGPVTVFLSIVPMQVAKVDVTVQNVYLDTFVTMSWQDDAMENCSEAGSGILAETPATWTGWSPSPVFVNHVDDGTGFTQDYCGAPPGAPPSLGEYNWTTFYGRITGTFVA